VEHILPDRPPPVPAPLPPLQHSVLGGWHRRPLSACWAGSQGRRRAAAGHSVLWRRPLMRCHLHRLTPAPPPTPCFLPTGHLLPHAPRPLPGAAAAVLAGDAGGPGSGALAVSCPQCLRALHGPGRRGAGHPDAFPAVFAQPPPASAPRTNPCRTAMPGGRLRR
jgi:hypothetical protein